MVESLRPDGTNDHVRPGLLPTEDDQFWVAAMRDVIAGSSRTAQWGALCVAVASLAGLIAVLTSRADVDRIDMISQFLWIMPLLLWSASFLWSVRVFGIRRYRYFANSPDSARQAIIRIGRRRADQLFWATGFWAAGILTVVVAMLHNAANAG